MLKYHMSQKLFHPLQVIFIHYKSRIATAIRGLYWMKITMVNSSLQGLNIILGEFYLKLSACLHLL